MEKKVTSHLTKGLIISLILIVLSVVITVMELYTIQWLQYIGFLILFGGIIWSVMIFGKENDYDKSFGNLFAHGFKTLALVTVLVLAYTLLSSYIFPDVKQKMMDIGRQQALEKANGNEAQIEQGMAMFEKYFTLFIVIGIIFWYMLIGAIASLIGAAVTKKNPNNGMPQSM
jgi:NADH:ubiquinone oxidoreductase subunit 6 (subunit J)